MVGPDDGTYPPLTDLEVLRYASIARARPVLFHPPFGPCIMGQIGLLVKNAYFAILDASKPMLKAEILPSRR